jgi:hypothetical protein
MPAADLVIGEEVEEGTPFIGAGRYAMRVPPKEKDPQNKNPRI